MKTLFSTEDFDPNKRFHMWREMLFDRVGPIEQKQIDDGPFEGLIQAADIGQLRITRFSESALQTEVTSKGVRQHENNGTVFVLIQLAGISTSSQDGREAVQRPGDIVILGGRPNVHVSSRSDQSFVLELPREQLETMVGSTNLYTSLTIGANLASTALAVSFFKELVRVHERLNTSTADRMSKIGIDLLIASIAERLAQEVPKSLHGTVVVQRAKMYIEANLRDTSLDPPQLAAAMGVSLRRLQELFHQSGRHISDWIWERRLVTAARYLGDHACRHQTIATIAYNCGFSHPTHFSRRFRNRYGMTPTEYRFTFNSPNQ